MELGFRTAETGTVVPVPAESLTIAGDLSIVNIQALLQYRISDLEAFVSNLADPEGCPDGATLRDAALAALSEVVGERSIGDLLGDDKTPVEDAATSRLQGMLDRYRSGLQIVSVRLEQVTPPEPVRDAYPDVARATQDAQVHVAQAKAYEVEIIAGARSEANGVLQAAEAAKSLRVIQAPGEAERFVSILREYELEQNAALRDMHLGSLEDILPGIGGFITAAGSSSRMVPVVGMTTRHTDLPYMVQRADLSESKGFGSRVPHPLNPDIHFDSRLLRIDLPP